MTTSGTGRGATFRTELPRKLVHAAVGLCALSLRWMPAWLAWAGAGAAVVFNAFFVHRVTHGAFLRDHERGRGFSTGVLLYPVAVLALFLVFARRLELAAAAFGLLAFGDAAATLGGLALGGPALPWNPRKRWTGLAAFTAVGTVAAALLLRWTQLGLPSPWVGRSFLVGEPTFFGPGSLVLWAVCLEAAAGAAVVESLDTGWDDNLSVAVAGGGLLWLATLVDPRIVPTMAPALAEGMLLGMLITALPALAARAVGAVTWAGAVAGWLLTALLYAAAGWRGLVVFGAFFVVAAGATRVGWKRKASLGVAHPRGGSRGAGNAVANTLVGIMGAYLAVSTAQGALFRVVMCAAFATAAFDTVASEIGQAFGRRHVLATTLRRVAAGTEGAVSLEGTAAGMAAAVVVALVSISIAAVTPAGAAAAVTGALMGSMGESLVGAALPGDGAQRNDVLNFVNTALGAAVACGLAATLGA
ncbi:MAG: DUF92 domain-containing protein [Gemmatimonadetes bacterium]|nr:DUF92 domain-containing protein [Gemmatimonadota bacterium]